MKSEDALVKLDSYRVSKTSCMSGICGNSFECHCVKFLGNPFVVEDISRGDVAIAVLSLSDVGIMIVGNET